VACCDAQVRTATRLRERTATRERQQESERQQDNGNKKTTRRTRGGTLARAHQRQRPAWRRGYCRRGEPSCARPSPSTRHSGAWRTSRLCGRSKRPSRLWPSIPQGARKRQRTCVSSGCLTPRLRGAMVVMGLRGISSGVGANSSNHCWKDGLRCGCASRATQ